MEVGDAKDALAIAKSTTRDALAPSRAPLPVDIVPAMRPNALLAPSPLRAPLAPSMGTTADKRPGSKVWCPPLTNFFDTIADILSQPQRGRGGSERAEDPVESRRFLMSVFDSH